MNGPSTNGQMTNGPGTNGLAMASLSTNGQPLNGLDINNMSSNTNCMAQMPLAADDRRLLHALVAALYYLHWPAPKPDYLQEL